MYGRRRRLTTGVLVVAAVLGAQGTASAAENLPPKQPATQDLLTGSRPCVSGKDRLFVRTAPTLRAVLSDQVPEGNSFPDPVRAEFEIWWQDADSGEQRETSTTTAKASGSQFSWRLPPDIPADTVISWRVRAHDGKAASPWSDEGGAGACEFVYDRVAPEKPVVVSSDYPDDQEWRDGVGVYAGFTVHSPSDDVVSYGYSFNGGPYRTVTPDTPGEPVTIRHLPLDSGVDVLTVQAFDRAGNDSAPATYAFRVKSGRAPAAHWKLADAEGSRSAAAEVGPASRAGGGATFGAPGPAGTPLASTVRLDGADGGFLTPDVSVVDTGKTFAVGGWVRPARLDRDMTAVSQDASTAPGFTLGARTRGGAPVWSFGYGGAQVTGGTPEAGEWAHVLGQYDAETGMAHLYVNGREVGTGQRATAEPATGDFQIGRARAGSGYGGHWTGEIGDVRFHDRVVVPGEVAKLAHRTPRLRGHWSLEDARDGASDELYGGAPLRLGNGAAIHRGPGGCLPDLDPDCPQTEYALVGDGDLALDGNTGFAATDGPVVDTEDSFSVAAVVRPAVREPRGPMTVLSQGGPNRDMFKVRYDPSTFRWQLVVSTADEPGAAQTVVSQAVSGPDESVRIAVVHDTSADQIRLYVDGFTGPDATAAFRGGWQSTRGLQVGRGRTADGWGEYLHGSVDEVHAFAGVLSETDIRQLGFGVEPCLC
ncbi:LamG-like jellyroll fold domain-containing protein [Streptomyces sp. NPDC095613]|uniref:LamG domain-containing protein n=1 Tax=Streptomyces sp. NPDC095613 TaxID=3155540 RepID=UPI00331A6357